MQPLDEGGTAEGVELKDPQLGPIFCNSGGKKVFTLETAGGSQAQKGRVLFSFGRKA